MTPRADGLTEAADYVAILERPAADLGQRVADLLAQPSALVKSRARLATKGIRQLMIRPLIQGPASPGGEGYFLAMRLALFGAGLPIRRRSRSAWACR